MKTYQSRTKESGSNFFKRHKYAITVISSMLLVAAAIAIAVVFTMPEKKSESVFVEPPNAQVKAEPQVSLPMKNAASGLGYYDNKIVKWETLDLWQWHPAMDFVGSGDVFSVMDGKVIDIEKTSVDGNVVTVEHSDGYVSVYKSLGAEIAVKVGDSVKSGGKLGTSSASMMSELHMGEHLHFELKKNGKFVDPITVLPISGDK